jgi:hypothetical protein
MSGDQKEFSEVTLSCAGGDKCRNLSMAIGYLFNWSSDCLLHKAKTVPS